LSFRHFVFHVSFGFFRFFFTFWVYFFPCLLSRYALTGSFVKALACVDSLVNSSLPPTLPSFSFPPPPDTSNSIFSTVFLVVCATSCEYAQMIGHVFILMGDFFPTFSSTYIQTPTGSPPRSGLVTTSSMFLITFFLNHEMLFPSFLSIVRDPDPHFFLLSARFNLSRLFRYKLVAFFYPSPYLGY